MSHKLENLAMLLTKTWLLNKKIVAQEWHKTEG